MEVGTPDEIPQIEIAPIEDPVPRENPRPVPEEPSYAPEREREIDPELVPA